MATRAAGLRVWLNGRLVPEQKAVIPAFDRGFLFGDGIYETIRAYRGVPFRLARHLERLAVSAKGLGISIPGGTARIGKAVQAVIAANRLESARIRITISRGVGWEPSMKGLRPPTILVHAAPYVPPSDDDYRRGVPAVIVDRVRNDRRAVDPAMKTTSLLNNVLAALDAKRAGAREAILLNPAGYVAEEATANVFWVRSQVVYTPSLDVGILAGVTRSLVLELARRLGYPVREGRFRPSALRSADEAFVTASTIEVLPLASVGRRRYKPFRPVTRALSCAYRVVVEHETSRR